MKHFILGCVTALAVMTLSYVIGYWVAKGWKQGSK
jgi:hypothetical protein